MGNSGLNIVCSTGGATKVGYLYGLLYKILRSQRIDQLYVTSASAIIALHMVLGNYKRAADLIVRFSDKAIFGGYKPFTNNGMPSLVAIWRVLTGRNSLGKQAGLYAFLNEHITEEMLRKYNTGDYADIIVYRYDWENKCFDYKSLKNRHIKEVLSIIESSSNIPVFINPIKLGDKTFFDGGAVNAICSADVVEMYGSRINSMTCIYNRGNEKETLNKMKAVKKIGWVLPFALRFFMQIRIPNESLMLEKLQSALCKVYGIKEKNYYSQSLVNNTYDNESEEKALDIINSLISN
jgi:predicted patatin/cPLA2 family phospholipase